MTALPHAMAADDRRGATTVPETAYRLTLYVSGNSDLSARAIANARAICEVHLPEGYDLAVVDLHDNPDALVGSNVIAAPTLVRNAPLPERMLVGDLSHVDKVLRALGLPHTGRDPG